MRTLRAGALAMVLAGLWAGAALGQVTATVPEEIPDTLPADLKSRVDPRTGVPADYVAVMFRRGTPVYEKTRVVSLVSGHVTGGRRFREESLLGGYYLVKIPTDGTLNPVFRACDTLNLEPSVVSAIPIIPISGGSP